MSRRTAEAGGGGFLWTLPVQWLRILAMTLVMGLVAAPVRAVTPDEVLQDAALEKRARTLSAEIRCLVCQNQSIDESNADLARDLRVIVRERLTAGDSNSQVLDYLVARYGEFILLKPRFGVHTAVLWSIAPILLLLGVLGLFWARRSRRRASAAAGELSADERDRVEKLLRE